MTTGLAFTLLIIIYYILLSNDNLITIKNRNKDLKSKLYHIKNKNIFEKYC